MTSPIAVLAITDFGTNWGERAWDRISGREAPVLASKSAFSCSNFSCFFMLFQAQTGIVREGGGKGPNIPEGLRQEIRGG